MEMFRYPASPTSHGGTLNFGRRKTKRPLCTKRALHVVMRASCAQGRLSLLQPNHARLTGMLLKRFAYRFAVIVYSWANSGNHVHMVVKAKTKEGFRNFLRTFAGQLAQRVTGAKPGHKLTKPFWDLLAFSRIVEWGKAYKSVANYILKNIRQAARSWPYYPITTRPLIR